jgi:hypothetical protein
MHVYVMQGWRSLPILVTLEKVLGGAGAGSIPKVNRKHVMKSLGPFKTLWQPSFIEQNLI